MRCGRSNKLLWKFLWKQVSQLINYIAKTWQDFIRFVDLEEELNLDNEAYAQLIEKQLTKTLYTRDDICEALGITEQQLEMDFLTPSTQHMQQFKLRQRALHVVQGKHQISYQHR